MNKEFNVRPKRHDLHEASSRGNTEMPQAYIAIAIRGLDAVLKDEDAVSRIKELVAPVPIDEHVLEILRKARAQHELRGIPTTKLTPERIRHMKSNEKRSTLFLLHAMLYGSEMPHTVHPHPTSMCVSDDWATPDEIEAATLISRSLTEDLIIEVRSLLVLAKSVLDTPEVRQNLILRKSLYDDWNKQPELEKTKTVNQSRLMVREVLDRIRDDIVNQAGDHLIRDELVDNFIWALEEIYCTTTE